MHTIQIHRRIESATLHIPELEGLIGRDVQIVVIDLGEERHGRPSGADYRALDDIAGKDIVDCDAYLRWREASML